MRTIENLREIYPQLLQLVRDNSHEIGDYEEDISYSNMVQYDKDGWSIQIDYECTGRYYMNGDLQDGWGTVTDIFAYYIDDETGYEEQMQEDSLAELYELVNEVLKQL